MNEYCGDRNVYRKLSTVDGNDNFRRLRGTQNDVLTLDCTRQASGSRQPYWKCEQQQTRDEFKSESHSEHKSIEGMRTSCSPNINEVSGQVKYKINSTDLISLRYSC